MPTDDKGYHYGGPVPMIRNPQFEQLCAERDAALLDIKARDLVIQEQSELVDRLRAEVRRLTDELALAEGLGLASSPPDDAAIERAARAIHEDDDCSLSWAELDPIMNGCYYSLARAALTAAREVKTDG